jgi:hypothetical protein
MSTSTTEEYNLYNNYLLCDNISTVYGQTWIIWIYSTRYNNSSQFSNITNTVG